jgi:aconitate hydratase
MGVLPLQFKGTDSWESLGIKGDESFGIELAAEIRPQQDATLVITTPAGSVHRVPLVLRIDTPIEVEYYAHGGILPFVLRQLLE